jgi:YD repeat-containing protein
MLGNLTKMVTDFTTLFDVNSLNQYTKVGGTSYTYDKNGNLTFDGTYTYSYDCENQLIEVRQGQTTIATYAYDYAGRRVSKTVSSVTTTYCYDGDQIIAEYENGTLNRKFIYGPGIDEPVCMITVAGGTETRYYYHYDGLGSVIALSNVNSQVVESYIYDSYGNTTGSSSVGNPYFFTARSRDTETGNFSKSISNLYTNTGI